MKNLLESIFNRHTHLPLLSILSFTLLTIMVAILTTRVVTKIEYVPVCTEQRSDYVSSDR